jgi:hypothetical protein
LVSYKQNLPVPGSTVVLLLPTEAVYHAIICPRLPIANGDTSDGLMLSAPREFHPGMDLMPLHPLRDPSFREGLWLCRSIIVPAADRRRTGGNPVFALELSRSPYGSSRFLLWLSLLTRSDGNVPDERVFSFQNTQEHSLSFYKD